MASKNLVIQIIAHQGYIRHVGEDGDYSLENGILFSSISETYLPLLAMLHRLSQEKIPCRIALVLSPVLCELLADAEIQRQYVEWLDSRIALGERELGRCAGDAALERNARECLEKARQDKHDFTESYSQNLLREFSEFAKKGMLELVGTCGTYAYLPHYGDMPEVLNAQIESGLYSHRHFFGSLPEGFWLPYMGYTPGIERILRAYGVNYTLIDIHGFLFGKALPEKGIFSPVRCAARANSLVFFTQDGDTPADILGKGGFAENAVYRDQGRDIGYDLPAADLAEFRADGSRRVPTGFRYWARGGGAYDSAAARARAEEDARTFLAAKAAKLTEAAGILGGDVSLVCVIPADALGKNWAEGMHWLESVVRVDAAAHAVTLTTCADCMEGRFNFQRLEPYPSACTGDGFATNLLDGTNNWMIRYSRKMCERMIDISDRFLNDTGLKIRLLNLGARELMLAQSAEWQKMIHDGVLPDYAARRFKESIQSFMVVYDSLGSNTVSTEWLTSLERKHTLFPWMNYRIFSPKR